MNRIKLFAFVLLALTLSAVADERTSGDATGGAGETGNGAASTCRKSFEDSKNALIQAASLSESRDAQDMIKRLNSTSVNFFEARNPEGSLAAWQSNNSTLHVYCENWNQIASDQEMVEAISNLYTARY